MDPTVKLRATSAPLHKISLSLPGKDDARAVTKAGGGTLGDAHSDARGATKGSASHDSGSHEKESEHSMHGKGRSASTATVQHVEQLSATKLLITMSDHREIMVNLPDNIHLGPLTRQTTYNHRGDDKPIRNMHELYHQGKLPALLHANIEQPHEPSAMAITGLMPQKAPVAMLPGMNAGPMPNAMPPPTPQGMPLPPPPMGAAAQPLMPGRRPPM